jgi:hypothetical protein
MSGRLTSGQRQHAARVAGALEAARTWTVTRPDGLLLTPGGGWTGYDAEALRLCEREANAEADKLRTSGRAGCRLARVTAART